MAGFGTVDGRMGRFGGMGGRRGSQSIRQRSQRVRTGGGLGGNPAANENTTPRVLFSTPASVGPSRTRKSQPASPTVSGVKSGGTKRFWLQHDVKGAASHDKTRDICKPAAVNQGVGATKQKDLDPQPCS